MLKKGAKHTHVYGKQRRTCYKKKNKQRREKSLSPKEILDDAFDFCNGKYPNDPMALQCFAYGRSKNHLFKSY